MNSYFVLGTIKELYMNYDFDSLQQFCEMVEIIPPFSVPLLRFLSKESLNNLFKVTKLVSDEARIRTDCYYALNE